MVLLIIIFPMIIIGGIFVYFNQKGKTNNRILVETGNIVSGESNEDYINDADSNLEKAPFNSEEYKSLSDGEYLTDKGYTLTIEDGVAYVEGNMIVNKTYSLPEYYKPSNPEKTITGEKCNNCIDKETMSAFKMMQSDASSIGLNIYISSGYRSYSYQEGLYDRYSAVDGIEGADMYSARAGHSEHQSGLCFDLNTIDDSFAYTSEGIWVNDNAHLYGFIIRYPKGKESITGYQYESWHLRYVGKELATILYNNGNWLTMEEYYGLSSNY